MFSASTQFSTRGRKFQRWSMNMRENAPSKVYFMVFLLARSLSASACRVKTGSSTAGARHQR